MITATLKPTSIRLTAAEKRRISAAARRRGMTPTAYIKRAALEGAQFQTEDARLDKLERISAALREAVEDVIDARDAAAAWERHVKNKTRLYTGEEVARELGLQD